MANDTLPDWYTPEQPETDAAPTPQQPAPSSLPSWYVPESVTVTADRPETLAQDAGDLAANVGTGIARIPGAIIGTPHTVIHAADWLWAKLRNLTDGGNRTGADVDQDNPLAQHTLSPEDVDNGVFKGISAAAGRPVTPYEPTSFIGKLLQAGVTGAGAGLVDPGALLGVMKAGAPVANVLEGALPRMAKTAIAADAANASSQAFPDSPGLAAAAALAAHTGAATGANAALKGYRTFAEPIIRPTVAGEALAGKGLMGVDNTQPGMAAPTTGDIDAATQATKGAVNDIGDGLDDYAAGGNIRADLQARQDALKAGRAATAATNYDAFRAEPPLEGAKLSPFMSSPTFRRAIKAAADGALDRGDKPLTDFWDFNEAGDPVLRPNAAVPPDILQRVKGGLDDAVESAKGNVARADATSLRDRFVAFLDGQYSNTYPKAREDFADASRPLDPLNTGVPGKVLDSTTQFGNRTYTMPQDKIAGTFLQSKALKSDYDQLIAAYGGDKAKALSNLEENLASKVQGAITGDGTLSLDAFNRSVRPYTKALSMWFPQLAQKFSSAEAAQKTLDTLNAQKGIADDVTGGALRDSDGFVTKSSLSRWLDQNESRLAKTQSKGAIMRLRQIAGALPEAPSAAPEAAVEAAPMAIGGALGGLEGSVVGGIIHKLPAYLAGPRLGRFRNAYSQSIEKAVKDPVAAQQLVALAAKRGGAQSIWNVLKDSAAQAAMATPGAVNAGAPATIP